MSFLVFVPIIGWAILFIAWAAFIAGAWIALCLMIEAGPFIGLGVFIKKITYDYNHYWYFRSLIKTNPKPTESVSTHDQRFANYKDLSSKT